MTASVEAGVIVFPFSAVFDERSELVADLARRVALAPHDVPTDQDLLAAADRLLVELDRREQP